MDHFRGGEMWSRRYYEAIPAQDESEEENPENGIRCVFSFQIPADFGGESEEGTHTIRNIVSCI
jgi:hypothetical protein